MFEPAVRKTPIVLTVILTLLWITSTWAPSRDEFSPLDTRNVFTYVLLVLAVEVLIYVSVSLLTARFGGRFLPSILNALFVLFNCYTIVLVHVEYVQGAPETLFYSIVSGIFVVAFILSEFAQSRVLLVLSAVGAAYTLYFAAGVYLQESQRNLPEARTDRIFEDPIWKFPEEVVYPRFKTKRNVYIIPFDALIPEPRSSSSGVARRDLNQARRVRQEQFFVRAEGAR